MTTFTHWRFHIDQQNIGWLELDVAGTSVNVLQREVMREWAEIMDKLIENKIIQKNVFSLYVNFAENTSKVTFGGYDTN